MIICSSSIGMESARTYTSVRMDAKGLRQSSGDINNFLSTLMNEGRLEQNDAKDAKDTEESDDSVSSLEESLKDIRTRFESMKTESLGSRSKLEQDSISRIKAQCLQFLIRLLFGKKAASEEADNECFNLTGDSNSAVSGNGPSAAPVQTVSANFVRINCYEEHEETTFSTTGKVVTASGKEIDFNLSLSMSRSFSQYYAENYQVNYSLTDPLVINLDTDIAEFEDQKFRFDLDSDGAEDEIAKLSSKSGYLALDLNNDGIINDGSELFGTRSGNGFEDLSAYDYDGNGWIDEADDVFDKLKIYVQNDDGSQSLYSLKDKGVGAIYLGSVQTEFSHNSLSDNHTNAVLRRTGMFLYENGNVGTIQHVDVARAEYTA